MNTYSAASLSADSLSDMVTVYLCLAGVRCVKAHGVGDVEDTEEPLVWSRHNQTSGHRRGAPGLLCTQPTTPTEITRCSRSETSQITCHIKTHTTRIKTSL